MDIQLDRRSIDQALPRVSPGLQKYTWLQAELHGRDVSSDREYQIRFNGFYRVRRNITWQGAFFKILERGKTRGSSFEDVLRMLHADTSRVEASFASKLTATIDPSKPVIDSIVLRNLGLRLPSGQDTSRRLMGIIDLHCRLERHFSSYLNTENGRYLLTRFRDVYPEAQLTEVKMLDLVLWQTRRPNKRLHPTALGAIVKRRG
jgi:hypothetical protein